MVSCLISCSSKKTENKFLYKVLGTLDNKIEIYYDENNQVAYLSDLENNEVVAFICDKNDYDYSINDFVSVTRNLVNNDMAFNEYTLKSVYSTLNWCKNNSNKEELIIDKKTKKSKKIYYITYREAYGRFHM